MQTIKDRMKFARQMAGLTQEQLAKKAGVATSTIGNIESGVRDTCRKIAAVAKALEVNASWLADNEGEMKPTKQAARNHEETQLAYIFPDEATLLTTYRKSTDRGKKFIRDAAEIAEKKNELPTIRINDQT